ncbi:alpha/beta hydrolase family protein [Streptomyces venezuelae]|uniref:alpha/beta hydrolase family protein n=1 Tax=Streptomyces venezuelae TaxID=54571 RepID=UPI00278C655B|nr:alpha/beta fold hydrolase [Streptomyces venezuelae]
MKHSRIPVLARITARDAATSTLRALAQPDPAAPVVVVLPAMGMSARNYTPLVRALHRAGLTVVTTDLRGHGESLPVPARGVRFGYREIVEEDIGAVLRETGAAFPDAPVLLLGHSLGGQLGLIHCGLRQPRLSGVVLVASGSAWYRCFGPLAGPRRLLLSQVYAAVAALLGHWPGERLGFAGRESARLIRDWSRQVRTGRYGVPGASGDYEQALGRVALPVLAVDVAGDALAPPAAVDHLCAKMPRADITRWHYGRGDAEGRPLDHFRWIRHHHGLIERITAWASQVVAAQPSAR